MGLLDSLRNLGKLSQDVGARRAELRARIDKLQAERSRVQSAPLARADVLAILDRWLARASSEYLADLRALLGPLIRGAQRTRSDAELDRAVRLFGAGAAFGQAVDAQQLDRALVGLLGDQVRAALVRTVEAMDWPSNALSLAERAATLAELDRELDALMREEVELTESARAAGLKL